ncbi:bifunctional 2-polyprenyl-6-hydroxyphenol methylase/3-demethylubiquinol 3-O-methyltransferase UbiG [Mechercharimyces sp. CAU 1602]|uniref:class I SAM-dependent methyltransferase n=1 Tax=Mechercharimyces sp. CAU 1602 TaxID=2973933 RepID=UPI002163D6EE|nr:class I SAM-dependent methyltransferase [Mechercharimyces sp. CAU 1602]MCS1351546.1 class I SAM-dependent methyltransferase [Mechercharimyces sp. CAU 1602]
MRSKQDISESLLEKLRTESINPLLLDRLVYLSRQYFAFFTKHTSRAYEYVWLLSQLHEIRGKKFLDIGTGLSPLPIHLAQQGAEVYTVDFFKEKDRYWGADRSQWYEWGFIDYHPIHPNIISYHADVNQLQFGESEFDCIYSISSVEHIDASARRKIWENAHTWLKPEGQLLLTVDIIKNSTSLHNYFLDVFVEDPNLHGNIDALIHELNAFTLHDVQFTCNIPQLDEVDIVSLACTK